MSSLARRARHVFALDVRSLALFRIALGFVVLLDVAVRAADLSALYTDGGVLPRALWFRVFSSSWSLHAATGSRAGEAALFVIAAACACAVVVGFRTRAAILASLVLAVSLQQRNPLVFNGFDLLERSLLLWSLLLPLGARFSVDAARASVAGARPRPWSEVSDEVSHNILSAGTVAFVLQTVLMYVCTASQMLFEPTWRDASALFLAFANDAQATGLARAIASHLDLVRALCPLVIAFQLTAPVLLLLPFTRARVICVVAFALFHGVGALPLSLGMLPLLAVVALLPLLPSGVWTRGRDGPTREPRVFADTRAGPALVAGALLAVVAIVNVEDIANARLLPARTRALVSALALDTSWNILVHPAANGWFVAAATLADGTVVDTFTGAPLTFAKPAAAEQASTTRWRKYRAGLVRRIGVKLRAPYAHWLCTHGNAATPPRLLELWFVREVERVDGAASSTSREKVAVAGALAEDQRLRVDLDDVKCRGALAGCHEAKVFAAAGEHVLRLVD